MHEAGHHTTHPHPVSSRAPALKGSPRGGSFAHLPSSADVDAHVKMADVRMMYDMRDVVCEYTAPCYPYFGRFRVLRGDDVLAEVSGEHLDRVGTTIANVLPLPTFVKGEPPSLQEWSYTISWAVTLERERVLRDAIGVGWDADGREVAP